MPLPIFSGIPGDSGMTPTRIYLTTSVTPCCGGFFPELAVYSLDASKFWNSQNMFVFGFYTSGVPVPEVVAEVELSPLNYAPAAQVYSLDRSKFWNSMNWFTFGGY